jgi:hypothetical protein
MSVAVRGRWRPLLAGAFLLGVGVTCSEPNGPGGRASIALVPEFTPRALAIYSNVVAGGLAIDNIHITLDHAGGGSAKDTVITVAGEDSIIVELLVDLDGPSETLKAAIELRDGVLVLFSGEADVFAVAGATPPATQPPSIQVEFTGPGSTVASIALAPADSTIATTTDSIVYRPTAKDQNNQAVADFALLWSVKDPTIGTVSSTGVFKAGAIRGSTYVIATTFNGIKDSAKVGVTPPPTKVVLISGGGQGGTVGKPLPQPFVFEVQASDNLPVPGRVVAFSAIAGAGSITPATAVTDANGRATATLTLGTLVAINVAQAASAGLTPAVANASSVADNAKNLAVTQQPSATIIAGTTLATQPKVQLQDQHGNPVSAPGIAIGVALSSPTGRTLTGTPSAFTDASGVATFTNLGISGTVGSTTLTFAQDTLTSAISSAIAVQVGAPSTIAIDGDTLFATEAGAPAITAPAIRVTDVGGNGIPNVDVHLVVTGGGITVRDTTIATDSTGRVVLNRLPVITIAGAYSIAATSGTLTGNPRTLTQTVTSGAAHHLKFGAVTNSTGGVIIAPAFTVDIQDQFNNRVTTGAASTASVVLGIKVGSGTAGAVLGPNSGAVTQNAVAGVATFNVSIDKAGTGYVLAATSPATASGAESAAFTIAIGAPAILDAVAGEGLGAKKGFETFPHPKVKLTDAGLNAIEGATVTFAITSGGGEVSDGNTTINATTDASGFATTDWHLGLSGSQTMTASSGPASFVFHAFLAETIVVVREPQLDPKNGLALSPQPKIQLRDLAGNQAKAAGVSVVVDRCCVENPEEIGEPLLSGTTTLTTDANGEVDFTDLALSGVVGGQTRLRFTVAGIGITTSAVVTLNAGAIANIDVNNGNGGSYRLFSSIGENQLSVTATDALENAAVGKQVQFFVESGSCTVPDGAVTADLEGLVLSSVNIPTSFTSCLIRAQAVGTGTQPKAYIRLYVTYGFGNVETEVPPTPFIVWTGAVGDDWSDPANWLNNDAPSSEVNVFIPFASGPADDNARRDPMLHSEGETLFSGGLYTEANAHVFLNGNELYVNTGLAAYGSIEGPGTLAIGLAAEPSGFSLLGTVHALLEVGVEGCTNNNVYLAFGAVVADSVVVNCPLMVADSGLAVKGDLRVSPVSAETFVGGVLLQSAGPISVGGNADVAGGYEQASGTMTIGGSASFTGFTELADGVLDVKGHFSAFSDCVNSEFFASSPHVLRMSGSAVTDTLFFDVNAPGCESSTSFGTIEMATSGAKGVAMPPHDATTVYVDFLRVKPGATFTMYPGTNLHVTLDGALDIEKDGTLVLQPGAGLYNLQTCELGVTNIGELHCSYFVNEGSPPPSGAAPAAPPAAAPSPQQAKLDQLQAKAAALRANATPFGKKKR